MRTFSSTVRCGNTAEIWNERTRPSRATSAGASAVMSRPLKTMRPRVGLQEFGQQVEAGGLAGAVRADQRVDGAARDPQAHAVHGDEAGEFLGEILGFEDDIVRCQRNALSRAHCWHVRDGVPRSTKGGPAGLVAPREVSFGAPCWADAGPQSCPAP